MGKYHVFLSLLTPIYDNHPITIAKPVTSISHESESCAENKAIRDFWLR